jgi:hypothetical protein
MTRCESFPYWWGMTRSTLARLILLVPATLIMAACGDNANDIARHDSKAGAAGRSVDEGSGGRAGGAVDGSGGETQAGASSRGGNGQGGSVARGGSGQGGSVARGGSGQGGSVARGGSGQGGSGQGGSVARGGSGQGGDEPGGSTGQGGNVENGGTGQGGNVENGGTGQGGNVENGGTGQGGNEPGGSSGQGGSAGSAQGGAAAGSAGLGGAAGGSYGGSGSGGSGGPQTYCRDFVCNGEQFCCGGPTGDCPTCAPAVEGGPPCEPVCYDVGDTCLTDGSGEYWTFPSLNRDCQTASDCFLAVMTIGPCGNLGVDAYAEGQQGAFGPYARACAGEVFAVCENMPPPRTASGEVLEDVTDARAECVQGSCTATAP